MTNEELSWNQMSFAQRKQNGKGHLFIVGCDFHLKAPFYFHRSLPEEGSLKMGDVVLVLENPSMYAGIRYFWKVLSKMGPVWCEPKHFSSEF